MVGKALHDLASYCIASLTLFPTTLSMVQRAPIALASLLFLENASVWKILSPCPHGPLSLLLEVIPQMIS